MLSEGGKTTLYIPSNSPTARGQPGAIGPDETLDLRAWNRLRLSSPEPPNLDRCALPKH